MVPLTVTDRDAHVPRLHSRTARALLALATLTAAAPLRAQQAATPWVPLDDAAYAYVDALIARGALRSLPTLERPYTTAQLRAALEETDTLALPPAARAWMRTLHTAVRRLEPATGDGSGLRFTAFVLGTAESSGRRELMLADDSAGVHPGVGGRLAFVAGPIVAAGRLQLDNRLKDDPDFQGSKRRSVTGRAEDAYVAGQWRYGSLFLGRQARSWGPHAAEGLQLGPYAYSWDHLTGRIGTDRIALTGLIARLDPYLAGGDSGSYERHVAMHRLSGRWRDLEVAASEAVVYGGPGRGMELAYANPLTLYQLAQYNETRDGNVSYALDASWRAGRRGVFGAQLLVDDFQIDRCSPGCEEPASWGATVTAEGIPLVGEQRLFASYTRVSNLTYRAPQPWESWTAYGAGMGRGFADYDEARVGLDLAVPGLPPLRAYTAHRRQGQGDYRVPFPATADYPTTPAFLVGTPERTWRVGARGGASLLGGRFALQGDVGYNRTDDASFVAGASRRGFEGRIRASLDVLGLSARP